MIQDIFRRTELLVGTNGLTKIQETKVILFGVGGVGSWCAEALLRSGIQHMTLVDFDEVCVTNINRQLMATTKTVGQKKVEALKQRLLDINPEANILCLQKIYSKENVADFQLHSYDYIIDAIDSLDNKLNLILEANKVSGTLFSSMGAALKLDPTAVKTAEFWKVNTCPLAAALRRKMRKGEKPAKKFTCVYSDEIQENRQTDLTDKFVGKEIDFTGLADETLSKKGQANGTTVFVTATFGLTLASLVIKDILNK